jgi:hypothetical protein
MFTEAVLAPVEVGVNVTEIVQLAPLASGALQVLVLANSALFVPVIVTPVTDNEAVPLFVNAIACAVLVVFT